MEIRKNAGAFVLTNMASWLRLRVLTEVILKITASGI